MPFSDFHGNADVVRTVREMLARDHFPHAVILSGPQGSGKFTLAQMVAKAMNCLERPVSDGLPDFCGVCANCTRIGQADALEERFAEAVEVRENLRDADKRETRILVQTHPDVTIIPPDPPQMLVKVDQVRHVIREIYYKPAEGKQRVYIFSEADFMKEAANSLLKILEEPPDFASIFLLTDNPSALLPTIRSRCMHLRLSALPLEDVESYLGTVRPELKPRETRTRCATMRRRAGSRAQFGPHAISGGPAGRVSAARTLDGRERPQRFVSRHRRVSRGSRGESEARPNHPHLICVARRPVVPKVRYAGTGAQHRY